MKKYTKLLGVSLILAVLAIEVQADMEDTMRQYCLNKVSGKETKSLSSDAYFYGYIQGMKNGIKVEDQDLSLTAKDLEKLSCLEALSITAPIKFSEKFHRAVSIHLIKDYKQFSNLK